MLYRWLDGSLSGHKGSGIVNRVGKMSAGISYSANRFAVAKLDAVRARIHLRARDITRLSDYEV